MFGDVLFRTTPGFTIVPDRKMLKWAVEMTPRTATFVPPAEVDDRGSPLLQIWPNHGFGIAESHLPGVYSALVEIMKRPIYWTRREQSQAAAAQTTDLVWSARYRSDDDGRVYLRGPANVGPSATGHRPAIALTIDHVDLRDLRIRLARYLARQMPGPVKPRRGSSPVRRLEVAESTD